MDSSWTHYAVKAAPQGILCQFTRDIPQWNLVCKPEELNPENNANGLYWRLTGIGREELERMNPRQRSIVEGFVIYEQQSYAQIPIPSLYGGTRWQN